jgi:hypothetical protein
MLLSFSCSSDALAGVPSSGSKDAERGSGGNVHPMPSLSASSTLGSDSPERSTETCIPDPSPPLITTPQRHNKSRTGKPNTAGFTERSSELNRRSLTDHPGFLDQGGSHSFSRTAGTQSQRTCQVTLGGCRQIQDEFSRLFVYDRFQGWMVGCGLMSVTCGQRSRIVTLARPGPFWHGSGSFACEPRLMIHNVDSKTPLDSFEHSSAETGKTSLSGHCSQHLVSQA